MQIDRDKTKWKEEKEKRKKNSFACLSPTVLFSPLAIFIFISQKKSFQSPSSLLATTSPPFYPSSIRQFCTKASNGNNSLYRRVSNEMAPIVPLQLGPKLLQPLGQIMCVYWFDSQVMGMRSVHIGSAIVAGGWLPSGRWHWNKEAFFPPFTRLVSWQIHWFSTQ